MIFGCTRNSSNKLGSALIGTKIRSGRILKKSLQPLNILDKVFTLKNSNKLDSVRFIRLLVKTLPCRPTLHLNRTDDAIISSCHIQPFVAAEVETCIELGSQRTNRTLCQIIINGKTAVL